MSPNPEIMTAFNPDSRSTTQVSKEDFVAYLAADSYKNGTDTTEISAEKNWDHQSIVGLVKSLQGNGAIDCEQTSYTSWKLLPEAEQILSLGSTECRLCAYMEKTGGEVSREALTEALGAEVTGSGFKNAMKSQWIVQNKESKLFSLVAGAKHSVDTVKEELTQVSAGTLKDAKKYADLKKRKLIKVRRTPRSRGIGETKQGIDSKNGDTNHESGTEQ